MVGGIPTGQPSVEPSMMPSGQPSQRPTGQPSQEPSGQPSQEPSGKPTEQPTRQPSRNPTCQPSGFPSGIPTANPTISFSPTSYPTMLPTIEDARTTVNPTNSFMPTSAPSTLYDGFYADNIIRRFKKLSGRGVNQFLSVNTEDALTSYQNGPAGIANLVKQFVFPQPMEFYVIMLDNLVATRGVLPTTARVNCSDPIKSTLIINSISKNIDIDMPCNGVRWQFVSQSSLYLPGVVVPSGLPRVLCVNCQPMACVDSIDRSFVFGSSDICFSNNSDIPIRTSVFMQIKIRRFVPRTVPEITNLNITSYSNRITFDITCTGKAGGGSLYCAAVESKSIQLVSTDQLKLLAVKVSFTQLQTINQIPGRFAQINVGKLISGTSYDVLCAGEDNQGNMYNFADKILPTLKSIYTTCCRHIVYTNAPKFVYGKLSAYAGVTNTNIFVFSYQIQVGALDSIEILPLILFANSLNVNLGVTVTPSSSVFRNTFKTVKVQSGSFILSCNGNIDCSGEYVIALLKVGYNKNLYSNEYQPIEILSTTRPPLPPVLSSAIFADSGTSVSVVFDSPTDQAVNAKLSLPYWRCSSIFSFRAASASTCLWLSSSNVQITFAIDASVDYVGIGDTITLMPNTLKAGFRNGTRSAEYKFNAVSTTAILPPKTPLKPLVVLIAPALLASCDDLILDATATIGKLH